MTAQTNSGLPYGLPAPGIPQRDVSPALAAAGGGITITQTPTTATFTVGQLGLTNGGLKTSSFAAASNTRYFAEGASITVTGPASPAQDDVLVIAVGASAVTFDPNGNKVNGQSGTITLLPFNTYPMTFGTTSGWC